jgi:hypothetical protein
MLPSDKEVSGGEEEEDRSLRPGGMESWSLEVLAMGKILVLVATTAIQAKRMVPQAPSRSRG